MPNERREQPVVQHEFLLDLAVTKGDNGAPPTLVLRVETVREFSSFGYTLELRLQTATSTTPAVLDIGGITVPVLSAQQSGSAVGTVAMAVPADGDHVVDIQRRQRRARAHYRMADGVATIVAIDGDPFIRAAGLPRP